MTETPWAFGGTPGAVDAAAVTLLEGTTFCISDRAGDITTGSPAGLFVRDTRVLCRWELRVGSRPTEPLVATLDTPFAGQFVGWSRGEDEPRVLVVRRRSVGNGMREEILLVNTSAQAVTVPLDLAVAADFADLFEVKDGRAASSVVPGAARAGGVVDLAGQRAGGEYGARVSADDHARSSSDGLHWLAELEPHGEWRTAVEVHPRILGERLELHHSSGTALRHAVSFTRRSEWHTGVPTLESGDPELVRLLAQSVEDLGSLRIFDPDRPELPVVAAGAPWFMALFGRDSLLTAMMTLPLDDSLARGAAESLAAHQGRRHEPRSEEEPGRILHEIRFGPAGTLALGGSSAYYGTADATPLFVMLLGALARWRGPEAVGPRLLEHADRALEWIRGDGDPDGDGFVEYHRKHDGGLVNQGWKDSWDGVNHADGRLAEPPIALAEVQAYVYAAYLARAELADLHHDPGGAGLWRERAAELRERFDRSFWLPSRGWYATALDRDKRPVDALTSNAGHCLWTGIALPERAEALVEHLMSPAMYSGWGIRTLATTMGAYDPLSYHNGSVWPHDTTLCVAGMARYGFREEARTVASSVLEAATYFDHRLPELFGGFARRQVSVPVPYAAACVPQAWAAAAPVELVRAMLGLEAAPDGLRCDPLLPARMLPLRLTDLVFRGRLHDVEVDVDGTARVSVRG